MNSKIQFLAVMLGFAFCATSFADDTPVGIWRTYDDSDGLPAALIQIDERNGVLEGRIVKLLPRPGHDVNVVCEKCEGTNKNQPIAGMNILWKMKRMGDEYSGGEIFDPDSGNTYQCKMRIYDKKLVVRGYLGITLFGRSQTWVREPTPTL